MASNSLDKIETLLGQPIFSASEARELGVHSRLLSYYCDKGILERISRGLYRKTDREVDIPFQWEDVALTAASIPTGAVCLVTALSYYQLTDEIPRQIWIAVPRNSWPPTRANTKIVRMSNIDLGAEKLNIGEIPVGIFDQERTIVDSFRLLSKEIAIKALKRYLTTTAEHKPDLGKLHRYANELRTNITPYVEALTI